MKHKVIINVTNETGQKNNVLKGSIRKLPSRIIRLLFGEYRQVYLLEPGMTVDSVDIREIEKGDKDVENKTVKRSNGRCRESCI